MTDATPKGATSTLEAILNSFKAEIGEDDPQITLGNLFARMEERAYGLLLLILALPCCLPFVYLLPQIVALPILLLAGQMAAGRTSPWLPERISERKMSVASLLAVVTRAKKYLALLEYFARPRLAAVTGHMGSRVVGALLIIPTASILVPLPMTNTVPGFGVTVAAVGLIERDALLVVGGLIVGFVWVGMLVIGGPVLISALIGYVTG